ncbi:MAG: MarR family transcriptional regulator [Sulfolobaceae archaeon]|nr:MarR family transcriptional regulator [Sulfolobaceae archaeon]
MESPQKSITIKLPSGRDAGLVDIMSFCYDLSETDVQVLLALTHGEPKSTENLEDELHLSKASINRSLNKLLELNLVMRVKESGSKAGRPRYLYKAIAISDLKKKILDDLGDCIGKIQQLIEEELK